MDGLKKVREAYLSFYFKKGNSIASICDRTIYLDNLTTWHNKMFKTVEEKMVLFQALQERHFPEFELLSIRAEMLTAQFQNHEFIELKFHETIFQNVYNFIYYVDYVTINTTGSYEVHNVRRTELITIFPVVEFYLYFDVVENYYKKYEY